MLSEIKATVQGHFEEKPKFPVSILCCYSCDILRDKSNPRQRSAQYSPSNNPEERLGLALKNKEVVRGTD